MKHLITKLLCALFIHKFSTAGSNGESATVVCNRTHCLGVWHVDFKHRTMELVKQGAYE